MGISFFMGFENDKRLKKAIFLDTKGVVNKKGLSKFTSLFNIFSKTLYCLGLYSSYDVRTVISVGGFIEIPVFSLLNIFCPLKFFIGCLFLARILCAVFFCEEKGIYCHQL